MSAPEFVIIILILDLCYFQFIYFFQVWGLQICSTSSPSGNMVGGLPLVVHTCAEHLAGRAGRELVVTKDRFSLNAHSPSVRIEWESVYT